MSIVDPKLDIIIFLCKRIVFPALIIQPYKYITSYDMSQHKLNVESDIQLQIRPMSHNLKQVQDICAVSTGVNHG